MFGGLLMCVLIVLGSKTIENCNGYPINGYGIAFIYLSYVILFVRFYIGRYLSGPKAKLQKAE